VLEIATDLAVVSTTDIFAINGTRKLLEVLEAIDIGEPDRHLVLNRANARVNIGRNEIESTLNWRVDVEIPSTRAVPMAMNKGESLFSAGRVARRAFDPLAELKTRVQTELFNAFDHTLAGDLSAPKVRRQLDAMLDGLVASEEHLLTPEERRSIIGDVADNVLGFGPIQRYLDDPTIAEIMVNAPDLIFVEREGRLEETDASFYSDGHLRSVIDRIVGQVGRTINESTPMVDARLADGSRVNAIVPPLAIETRRSPCASSRMKH